MVGREGDGSWWGRRWWMVIREIVVGREEMVVISKCFNIWLRYDYIHIISKTCISVMILTCH